MPCELVESPLVVDIERADAHLQATTDEHDAQIAARHAAAEQLSAADGRVDALQLAVDAAHARAGAARLDGLDGVLGSLLDLVRIDDGWEPAVEAALGDALAAVVVTDPQGAGQALHALRASSHHRRRRRPRHPGATGRGSAPR